MTWQQLLEILKNLQETSPELLEKRVEIITDESVAVSITQSLVNGTLYFTHDFEEVEDEGG